MSAALTRRLLLFALANFVLVNAAMLAASVPARDTDLHPLAWFLTLRQGGDSWRPMNEAYDFATTPEGRGRTLYDKLFFSPAVKHKGFQYPPTSLLAIGLSRVFGAERGLGALETITWLFVPFTALCAWGLYSRPPREDWLAALALASLATLTFYPAMRAYRNGQIQAWINGIFGASLFALAADRKGLAGGLAGLLCLIKPQYALVVLWGALRREWTFARAAFATAAAGCAASVLAFGLAPHLEYVSVLRFIAQRGESFYPNQSVNGLMNRAVGNGANLAWMDAMPEPQPLVRAATWLSSAALLAWALWPRARRSDPRAVVADFAMIGLACTAASPIAWEHHYGLLLPIFAWLASAPGRSWPLLAAAYLLTSHTLRVTDRLADTPLNVLQSYIFVGALVVLVLLDRARSRAAPEPGVASS